MGIVHEVSVAAGHAMQGIRAGNDKLASHKLAAALAPEIEVHSVAFEPGLALPISCTIDGVGAPPALGFTNIPAAARSLVVLCEDPDAPQLEPFLHWSVYGIPSSASDVDAQTQHDYRIGENSRSELGYTPAAPPPGHGLHHYHFQVFALDVPLELAPGAERDALLEAMTGHVLAWGEIVGTYERE
ncbi:MAG TPA: YbhB/YbcL family Raf kinase inhibitor-like protein [Polyangiaceae bacterium]|nr:YbhB/YbcL family Raf kinase inhibitor-like protein [Polyangiaceae bacterium]